MKCVICLEKIKEDDDFFRATLFKKGRESGSDYAHENCWKTRIMLDKDYTKKVIEKNFCFLNNKEENKLLI